MRRLLALLLGLCATFLILEFGLWLSAELYVAHQVSERTSGSNTTRTVLALGESTTAIAADPTHGQLVSTSAWPQQLEQILNERSDEPWRVINRGVLGGTSNDIVNRIETDIKTYNPQTIVAMMGMQDQAPRMKKAPNRKNKQPSRWWMELRTVRLWRELTSSPFISQKDFVPTAVSSWSEIPQSLRERAVRERHIAQETRLLDAPREVLHTVDLGMYFWLIGHPERAESIWLGLIESHGMGANLVARVMLDRGDIDGAKAILTAAMEQTPEEGLYAEVLARALVRSGRMDEAIALLENAITKPCMQQPEVRQRQYLALASALIQADRPAEAQQALQHVDQEDKNSKLQHVIGHLFPESRLIQGEVHLALGELDEAQEVFEVVLRRNPGLNEAMVMLEQIYQEKGQMERAVPLRRELLFRRRRVAEFYQFAKMQKQMGQSKKMESLFHKALEGVPLTDNYERLYQAATAHGVQVLAVQYPTFALDLLRLYAPDHEDLRLVDTEHIFDNLPPDSVFVEPRFPYNFAHYTHEGARLLAERIASEVLDRPQSTP